LHSVFQQRKNKNKHQFIRFLKETKVSVKSALIGAPCSAELTYFVNLVRKPLNCGFQFFRQFDRGGALF
ncbi:MAG: hypothetical protein REI96_09240, partial [Flavobacterium nitrogenifigens]|uniref:hypothetical protein n=1 Tax=Flavobacterium nitrogenifigens TaxID=1617283 RepID=UPI00280748F2